MNPPYQITPVILKLIASVSEKLGQINAKYLDKPSVKLRKENQIKTIQSSLSIEGNTLTTDQITALLDKKRVIGPEKDVNEVLNAINVYQRLNSFNPTSSTSFLKAHKMLMNGLITDNGKYRTSGVGIVSGNQMAHMAPPSEIVPYLMNDLFDFLKESNEIALIKSCVFHYEMEFIHPFMDGNGRMGRLWQTLLLMQDYPVFEFIPFENIIHKTQNEYYQALSASDKLGASTPFIEYMLQVINNALHIMLESSPQILSAEDRLRYFVERCKPEFSRKDYLSVFKEISTATASRDLKLGIELGMFEKEGDKIKTIYRMP
jgi:Fic family protein